MVKRAKEMGQPAGLEDRERLLEHPEDIPKDWKGKIHVFPATEAEDTGDYRHVPSLYGSGDQWDRDWNFLGSNFYSDYRVVLRK